MRPLKSLSLFFLILSKSVHFSADFQLILVFFHSSHNNLVFTSFSLISFNEVIKFIKIIYLMIPFSSILLLILAALFLSLNFFYNDLILAISHCSRIAFAIHLCELDRDVSQKTQCCEQ